MHVVRARIHRVRLPLRQPFVVAYARWDHMPSVLLELETDTGQIGWGEAVPDETVTGEHARATANILEHLLVPVVLGKDAGDIDLVHHRMSAALRGNSAAKAAVDIALQDLLAQDAGMPLHRLLGGHPSQAPTYPRVISLGEPTAMAESAEAALAEGYEEIKLKVGAEDVRTDIARIRAVCEALAGRASVRVDVNQHWGTPAVAVPAIRQLEGLNIRWVEQPVYMDDVAGLAEVRSATSIPVMADESVHGMRSLLDIIRQRAADAVNIKLMKTGGIQPALAMIATAQAAGLAVQIGSMVESSIGSAAGFQVAGARRHVTSTELTGPLLFRRDVGDLAYEPPIVHLPTRAGLGIRVDHNVIDGLREGNLVEVRP
ncbi:MULTISPECIES: mandelate racemase/muconate lactonizing enzyme family protein [unclassified Ornithinimicrobium]|uniref:mandelate racemase/muconate lactonizing enzyme family protein n=1 Tax=unclassified Ornithinimicrobium TaxID=2615080 RepID=UPI003851D138